MIQGIKKEGEYSPSFKVSMELRLSAEKKAIVSGPVCQYGGIDHFTAARTFPGVKGPHKIIELFGEHAAFALRTIHTLTPIRFNRHGQVTWVNTPCMPIQNRMWGDFSLHQRISLYFIQLNIVKNIF